MAAVSPLLADPESDVQNTKSKGRSASCIYLEHYLPIVHWLPEYDYKHMLQNDISCAATLGFVLIGQSLAHANLCGVPVMHGPHSCIVPPLIYALFGTCNQGSVGTGGLLALLTGLQLQIYEDVNDRVRACGILGLLVGLIMVSMGIMQLSFLVRFLSRPALNGFVTGSAILIIKAMVVPMLGISKDIEKQGLISNFLDPEAPNPLNPATCGLSFAALLFLYNAKRLPIGPIKQFKELVVLAVAALFTFAYGEAHGLEKIGHVDSGLPRFEVPELDMKMIKELFPGAVLIAMVCFISSFAAAKSAAIKGDYRVDAFNELLGLGLSNMGSAFFGGVPTQIGLSRSALAQSIGAKTQVGVNIFVAVVVASIVFALAPLLFYVPKCVLDAIIVNAAIGLFEIDKINTYTRSHHDRMAMWGWLAAFFGTVFIGCFEGICIAVGVSLFMILYNVVNPHMHVLGFIADQELGAASWVDINADDNFNSATKVPHIMVVRIAGPLFYANSERLQDAVQDLEAHEANCGNPIAAIVLSATSISFVDTTALETIADMMKSCQQRRVKLYIAGAFGHTRRSIQKVLGEKLDQKELRVSIDDCVALAQEALGLNSVKSPCGKKSHPSLEAVQAIEATHGVANHMALPRITDRRVGSQNQPVVKKTNSEPMPRPATEPAMAVAYAEIHSSHNSQKPWSYRRLGTTHGDSLSSLYQKQSVSSMENDYI